MESKLRSWQREKQQSGIDCASLKPVYVQVWAARNLFSLTPVRPRPVNPPTSTGHGSPKEPFERRLPRMMVENGSAFVESPRVPRIAELEQLVIEMVTKLMAQRTQECPKRCDFFFLAVRIHTV